MTRKITDKHLKKAAIIYVRQSKPDQVRNNRESQRLQYELADRAKRLGFKQVHTIADDMARTASGLVERRGFERLVATVCEGRVGAVFCLQGSRLARNGREWHHLIDFCGLVGTLIIDLDGIYDPSISNDRLLLGVKGTLNEFELTQMRQRSLEAIRSKARRGELQFMLPVGLVWSEDGRIELEPDRRVQESLQLVFKKFTELRSVRQVLMWLAEEEISLPHLNKTRAETRIEWKPTRYMTVLNIIKNPAYAGVYAFGRTESRTRIIDGSPRRTRGHHKPREEWLSWIPGHHPGYIPLEQYERNQSQLAENTFMKATNSRKSARGGKGLLAGMLRCARCGRMLHIQYDRGGYSRYECRMTNRTHGAPRCISFGGLVVDRTIGDEVLRVVQPRAVEAAVLAAEKVHEQEAEKRAALELELEQARYQARIAARRYEAVDPDNRLVVPELEARWNSALEQVERVETRLDELDRSVEATPIVDREHLMALADDLPSLWKEPSTDMRVKQRIVRLLIQEIVCDIDKEANEIALMIHWKGGRHSELRIPKRRPGQHSRCNPPEALNVIQRMVGRWPDEDIAATLNRLGLKTGAGNTWTASRVYSVRQRHGLIGYAPASDGSTVLTLNQAAQYLQVGPWVVRTLIQKGILEAKQVVPSAPWEIKEDALKTEAVQRSIRNTRSRRRSPCGSLADEQSLKIPGI